MPLRDLADARGLPVRGAAVVRCAAGEIAGRRAHNRAAAHLAARRKPGHRLDRRRYWCARLVQARLSVRPRARPCAMQQVATPGDTEMPSQWLEEAMVEAFSLRGLGLLADSWEEHPPFPNDAAFAGAIRKYRQNLLDKYGTPAGQPPVLDLCAWLRRYRDALDHS